MKSKENAPKKPQASPGSVRQHARQELRKKQREYEKHDRYPSQHKERRMERRTPLTSHMMDEVSSDCDANSSLGLGGSAQRLHGEEFGTKTSPGNNNDELEAFQPFDEAADQQTLEATTNRRASRLLLQQLAQDNAEVEEFERKLGIRKSRRSLPQSFKDDGLDELIGDLRGNDSASEYDQRKRKADYDSWLLSKRRKPNTSLRIASVSGQSMTLDESGLDWSSLKSECQPSMHKNKLATNIKDYGVLGEVNEHESESLFETRGRSFEGLPTTPAWPTPPRKDNPYIAPLQGNRVAIYVPPSKRTQRDETDRASNIQIQRKVQGLVNRLTDANLVSLIQSVEAIYQSNARGEVTEILTEAILAQMRKPETLPDQFLVLIGGFSAGIYKIMGSSFGSHLVRLVVREFNEQYDLALPKCGNDDVIPKEPSNFLSFLTQLYVFDVVKCNIIFDYMKELLQGLSELNVELLLRICRMAGRFLRRDDAQALTYVSNVLNEGVSRVGYSNVSVRTKFMVETIQDLKNSKAKVKSVDSVIVSEHMLRMKKRLGELKTQSRRLSGLTAMGIGLKDIEDVDKHGRWWLVGASVPEYRDVGEGAKTVPGQVRSIPTGTVADEDMDFVLPDFPQKAKAQGLITSTQIAIFTAIMSAIDYEQGYRQFTNLRLKRDEQPEVTKVLIQCVGSELHYNKYYALVGRQACANGKVRFAFQDRLWKIFRSLGEPLFGEEGDDEQTMETQNMKNKRRLHHVAQFYASLVASGALSITMLKPVELPKLNSWSDIFVECFMLSLFRESANKNTKMERIFRPATKLPTLAAGIHWYLAKKMLHLTNIGEKERRTLQTVKAKIQALVETTGNEPP